MTPDPEAVNKAIKWAEWLEKEEIDGRWSLPKDLKQCADSLANALRRLQSENEELRGEIAAIEWVSNYLRGYAQRAQCDKVAAIEALKEGTGDLKNFTPCISRCHKATENAKKSRTKSIQAERKLAVAVEAFYEHARCNEGCGIWKDGKKISCDCGFEYALSQLRSQKENTTKEG